MRAQASAESGGPLEARCGGASAHAGGDPDACRGKEGALLFESACVQPIHKRVPVSVQMWAALQRALPAAAPTRSMSNGSGSGEGAHAGHLRLYVEDQGTGKRSNAFCVCLKTDRSGTYITRLPPMAVGRICIGWELQGSQLVMRVV
ncbi:hypothetical protein HYH02_015187 [Chlamydomonas schloesseri]|uniref:Uncharacterized protein n=1 Tax=Chlamydomonas schloesseri TaxID=2026947 RepID=A0A835SBN2_9CHLO|nr:hypothetical protein HYH02_015187 [Chlamydomonas schloesseri]|eukprot:KAG2424327.1 hypothetical protein HYH02_015187 [Chlamydomonas schloesseri]